MLPFLMDIPGGFEKTVYSAVVGCNVLSNLLGQSIQMYLSIDFGGLFCL